MDEKNGKSLEAKLARIESNYNHLAQALDSDRRTYTRHFDSIEATLAQLSNQFTNARELKWPVIISFVMMSVALFGTMLTLGQVMFKEPVLQHVNYLENKVTSARELFKEHIKSDGHPHLEKRIASFQAATNERLREIETQLTASSHIANLQVHHLESIIASLWSKTFPDIKLKEGNYRPGFRGHEPLQTGEGR